MKHTPRNARRAAFWLVLVTTAGMGLVLLLIGHNHKITGALALGVVVVLVIKHLGLFMLVGAPLVGLVNAARARLSGLWRTDGGAPSD